MRPKVACGRSEILRKATAYKIISSLRWVVHSLLFKFLASERYFCVKINRNFPYFSILYHIVAAYAIEFE